MKYINQIKGLQMKAEAELSTLHTELSTVDNTIQDLLHRAEFNRFNVVEGYYISKQIKDVRVRRRQIKNHTQELTSTINYFKQMILQMTNTYNQIQTSQSTKIYTPRVLKEGI